MTTERGQRASALLDGALSASEEATLRAELARVPALAARLAELARVDAALKALPARPVPAEPACPAAGEARRGFEGRPALREPGRCSSAPEPTPGVGGWARCRSGGRRRGVGGGDRRWPDRAGLCAGGRHRRDGSGCRSAERRPQAASERARRGAAGGVRLNGDERPPIGRRRCAACESTARRTGSRRRRLRKSPSRHQARARERRPRCRPRKRLRRPRRSSRSRMRPTRRRVSPSRSSST